MRHNDLELQSMLRLARSCLKYERVPGEMCERDFFDKFDAEHALAERSKERSEDSRACSRMHACSPAVAIHS